MELQFMIDTVDNINKLNIWAESVNYNSNIYNNNFQTVYDRLSNIEVKINNLEKKINQYPYISSQ